MSDLLSRSLDDLIAARATKPNPRTDGGDKGARTGGPKAERSGPKQQQRPAPKGGRADREGGQQSRVITVQNRAAERSERRGREARQDVSLARIRAGAAGGARRRRRRRRHREARVA
jgi:hypothetical protein